jgi:glucose/arabinose dehydrogenase
VINCPHRMKPILVALVACALAASAQPRKYNLPPPDMAGNKANPAKMVPQPPGASLKVPAGLAVEEFASGLAKPRGILQLPNGTILVTDSVAKGGVYAVEKGAAKKPFIEGLDRPYGMALYKGYLYVAEPESLKRYKLDPKTFAPGPGEQIVALPGYGKGHWTRSIAFDAKADKLYLSVGSGSNVDLGDPEDRAAIHVYNPDGTGKQIFATGLRNPVCIRFNPQSNKLWTTIQERDGLGDQLPPDYFTEVRQGAFYGWPYAYDGPNEEPRHKGLRPDLVAKTVEPDVLLNPHASAMDFLFYTGKALPAKYRNGALIVSRGSSGRAKRVGYEIVFVPFKNGKPAGAPEPFLTGFMLGEDVKEVWGRPVGIAQLADGSLLLSEDGNNKIYRIFKQ